VFAAGDAVNGGASVVQAVADAKRAVRALEEALR
jgi:NADPH-dependent glutamate synthase beta subunit-like oxidoreductase